MNKFAKFESNMLENGKDMDPQSREILQTFVCWGAQTKRTNICKISRLCGTISLCQLPPYYSQTWHIY